MTTLDLQNENRRRRAEKKQNRRKAKRKAPPVPRAAYTVPEFCEAHRISRALFYTLLKAGLGPAIMKAKGRTLVTVEAASDWRREGTAAAATA